MLDAGAEWPRHVAAVLLMPPLATTYSDRHRCAIASRTLGRSSRITV
jgi:hypothetical protein